MLETQVAFPQLNIFIIKMVVAVMLLSRSAKNVNYFAQAPSLSARSGIA